MHSCASFGVNFLELYGLPSFDTFPAAEAAEEVPILGPFTVYPRLSALGSSTSIVATEVQTQGNKLANEYKIAILKGFTPLSTCPLSKLKSLS